jgi:hypothetical protein
MWNAGTGAAGPATARPRGGAASPGGGLAAAAGEGEPEVEVARDSDREPESEGGTSLGPTLLQSLLAGEPRRRGSETVAAAGGPVVMRLADTAERLTAVPWAEGLSLRGLCPTQPGCG